MSKYRGKSTRQDTQEYTEQDIIQEQRATIRRLTKALKAVRKERNKQRNVEEDYEALINEVELAHPPISNEPSCPEKDCEGPLKRLDFPKFFLDVCQSCRYRKRITK